MSFPPPIHCANPPITRLTSTTGHASPTDPASPVQAPGLHALSPLERLPEEMRQMIFSYLPPRDTAALAATSRTLHRSVHRWPSVVPLAAARLADRMLRSDRLPNVLAEALYEMESLHPVRHAEPVIHAAAVALLGLRSEHRHGWLERLSVDAATMGFPPHTQARLERTLQAVSDLSVRPFGPDAVHGAFDTLIDATAHMPPHAQDRVARVLAEWLWRGDLGYQGSFAQRDPRVFAKFRRLLDQAAEWPQERAIRVLIPLLLGIRQMYAGDHGPAFEAAMPVIRCLGPKLRTIGLECLRRGLAGPCEGVDYRRERIEDELCQVPGAVHLAARAEVDRYERKLDATRT
ncbi:F-box protein [Xylophilus sp. GOD-11R]|uniref:F-box protein n=1 Tax=Xylophilus sp. GOD-11R TaxID=3089814 RepID=UPI00298D18FF|nr:F-box protein [Xylophilus sp. GOD-11R]WPB57987.1 F-box protein [Xylophilus sp. GOD-11R]